MTDHRPAEITVSMPTYLTPELCLRRAVSAVLSQRLTSFRLVIVADGEERGAVLDKLGSIADDERVIVFQVAHNYGRYFADAVTLMACDTPYWTIHDSDDQAGVAWLGEMHDIAIDQNSDIVYTDQHVMPMVGQRVFDPVKLPGEYARRLRCVQFGHYAHGAGLWRTSALRLIGGPSPAFRVGYDSMLSTIAVAELDPSVIRATPTGASLYTRHKRHGSLTTSAQTGMRSDYRRRQRELMAGLWCGIQKEIHRSGATSAGERCRIIGEMVRRFNGEIMLGTVEHEARALRAAMRGES